VAGLADPNAAIELSLARANRLMLSGSGNTLAILQQADRELLDRLQWIAKKHGGPAGTYTEAHAQIYRQQIRLVTNYVQQRMLGKTDEQAREAIQLGVKQTVDLATRLEEHWTGITRPLALHSQQMQDEIVRGTGASRIRQNEASWERYGAAMTTSFERQLRVGQLMGLTHSQLIDRVVSEGAKGGIDAAVLHGQTPGAFPPPTGYVRERYWAERIVRTETANAYNSANLNTMQGFRNTDFPDMQKKILAHFDNRTAPDSIAVHGQIRPLDGYFMDGAGRQYLHPPGRPNDRECVIPWRPHWQELEATEPPTPAEQVEAQQEATGQSLAPHLERAKKAVAASALLEAKALQKPALEQAKADAKQAQQEGYKALELATKADAVAKGNAEGKATIKATSAVVKEMAKQRALESKIKDLKAAKAAKVEAIRVAKKAEREAKLKADAKDYVAEWKAYSETNWSALMKSLKAEATKTPRLLAAVWSEVTGKPAAQFTTMPPMQKGLALKAIGKHLYPELAPKPKPKEKKAPPVVEQPAKAFHELQPEELAKTIKSMSHAEVLKALAANPISAPVSDVFPNPDQINVAKQVLEPLQKQWNAHYAIATSPATEIKTENIGGATYHNVWVAGKKESYFFEENGQFVVKPPVGLAIYPKPVTFADKPTAAAYSLSVAEAIQKAKLEQKAAAAIAYVEPGSRVWSDKYRQPERRAAEVKGYVGIELDSRLKPDRAGHSVVVDGDQIEGQSVHTSWEVVDGKRELVARFKVLEKYGKELEEQLKGGPKDRGYEFLGLSDLDESSLKKAKHRTETIGDVVTHRKHVSSDVTVSLTREPGVSVRGSSGVNALHNLVEVRVREGKETPNWEHVASALDGVKVNSSRPKDKDLEAQTRAKVIAIVSKQADAELQRLEARTPAKVDQIWKKWVKQNPLLAEVAADAEMREVAPGHVALYSKRLAQAYIDKGVTHLFHDGHGVTALEQLFLKDETESGLLASKERYTRGVFTKGMSTSTDFGTGGADGVFTRVSVGKIQSSGEHGDHFRVEIDPMELGRLDRWAFNGDRYGRAGGSIRDERVTAESFDPNNVSHSNETMFNRSVGVASMRRVVVSSETRQKMLLACYEKGKNEINGIPVEDFFVSQ
jgi:hypothetical protein